MDFVAAIAVGFEADLGFEELDLSGVFLLFGWNRGVSAGFLGWSFGSLLGLGDRKNRCQEKRNCECVPERMETKMKSQDGLAGSLGEGRRWVKRWLRWGCRMCTTE